MRIARKGFFDQSLTADGDYKRGKDRDRRGTCSGLASGSIALGSGFAGLTIRKKAQSQKNLIVWLVKVFSVGPL